jgi:hypothetical protein
LKQQNTDLVSCSKLDIANNVGGFNSPTQQGVASPITSDRFSWIKRCTELIFKNFPKNPLTKSEEFGMSGHEDTSLTAEKLDSSNGYRGQKLKLVQIFDKSQPIRYVHNYDSKVILEGDISKVISWKLQMEVANERLHCQLLI